MKQQPSGHLGGPILRGAVLACLRSYQLIVSPLLPPACRFSPTCSRYAMEAVRRHGVRRGLRLTALRLLRCHPFCAGGLDEVPAATDGEPRPAPAGSPRKTAATATR
ncbi:MAG: membrane protein insertion efficiency factor YidD [Candidatus Tectomicrobia bacterium]|nr:membrane protein insertion efficiency factor YidD [Candidatus Tectomicrobia bacterium]